MKTDKEILLRNKNYRKQIIDVLNLIKQFDRIVVFRHSHPDYDAFGTQLGLASFIKNNFAHKSVYCVGDDHISLTGQCFPKMDELDDKWFDSPFLAFVVDCSNQDRIADERFKKATKLIKIDHHPDVEKFGDVSIVDTSMSAAGELMTNIIITFGKKYSINKETAEYLYKAIVGDSGRFLYESTTIHTFKVCEYLLNENINLTNIYKEMYNKSISDLEVQSYILKNYHVTKHGVAYYVLDDATLKKLNLPPQRGKDNVNIFAHYDGIHAWMSCTEDKAKGEWRVSIRSEGKSIQQIAEKYEGGGHDQASGAKLKTFAEFEKLVEDIDKLFE